MARPRVQIEPVHPFQVTDDLKRLVTEWRFAVEGMEHDAFEHAFNAHPREDVRPIIIHAQIPNMQAMVIAQNVFDLRWKAGVVFFLLFVIDYLYYSLLDLWIF